MQRINEINYNPKNFNSWSISEKLFLWLLENVKKGSTTLELGSGNATFELVKHYTIHSVEHDIDFINKVPQSNYIYAPLVKYENDLINTSGWYNREILKNNLPKHYDVLLIDGPIMRDRLNFINHYDLFNFDCITIFDDTNRPEDNLMATTIAEKMNKTIKQYDGEAKKFSVLI